MTKQELKEALTNIKYKSNWSFEIKDYTACNGMFPNCVLIRIHMNVPDRITQETIDIWRGIVFTPSQYTKWNSWKQPTEIVFTLIKEQEIHEAQEMFFYNNKRIYDPHKEGMND